MKLIFVGPQASGKGTQAKFISEKLGLCHISTGDLLREAKGELKEKVDEYMNSGQLVPDELILDILKERLDKPDCKNGFILDGFPRNLSQAEALEKEIGFDKIIEISIPDEVAIERLASRVSCSNCGAVYNDITNPPKEKGKCDLCGSELYKRKDDNEEAIRKRLEIYHSETEPILDKYDSIKINGTLPIEKVGEEILKVLEE